MPESTLAIAGEAQVLDVERAAAFLASCKSTDDVRDVRDKALAIATYQRTRGAAYTAQADAAEIALRAERRLGELCAEIADRTPKAKRTGDTASPVLADLGITKKQSSRWQKLAGVPSERFDAYIADARAGERRICASGAIAAAKPAAPPRRALAAWSPEQAAYLEAAIELAFSEISWRDCERDAASGYVREVNAQIDALEAKRLRRRSKTLTAREDVEEAELYNELRQMRERERLHGGIALELRAAVSRLREHLALGAAPAGTERHTDTLRTIIERKGRVS